MNKKIKRITIGIGLLILITILAYPKIEPLLSNPSENQEETSDDIQRVNTVVVSPNNLQHKISTTGSIRADETVDLRSEVSGKITNIHFDEGQPVTKDQLLLKTNDSELRAQLQRAEHRLQLAEQQEQRQAKLLEKGGISQEDYDATLNEVNVLRSEINLIEAQIEKTEIRAPFDGKVGLKYVSSGSYISPTTRIATLQNIDPVKIDFTVPERYAGQVDVGDTILFDVQTADSTFEGEIYAIEPEISSDTRSLQIRAVSENKEALLLPGSFANIELILETREQALTVPSISLVPEQGGQFVYLYSSGKVKKQQVSTGIRNESMVEITQGLAESDTVLTSGLLQVRNDMPVQVSEIEMQGTQQ